MKVVNDVGLPGPIMKAIERHDYDPGESDKTVTTLIGPPLIPYLIKKHGDEVEENASGRLFSLMGRMMHKVFEVAGEDKELSHLILEKRLYTTVDGCKVGGQIDVIDPDAGIITDYKVCSYWTAIYGAKIEWEQQQNIYRLLARDNGYDINRLQIAAMYRDWSAEKADRDPSYPSTQMQVIELPVWDYSRTEKYLSERIKVHSNPNPPICTPEERWERDTKYAIEKDGRKSALKLCDSAAEASMWMANNVKPHEMGKVRVVKRLGESKRCKRYCPVAKFCEHGRKVLAN